MTEKRLDISKNIAASTKWWRSKYHRGQIISRICLTTINKEKDTALLHANKGMTDDTFIKNIWIGDTGASCHMPNLADRIFETTDINEQVKVGNSTKMTSTKIGKDVA